MGAAVDVTSQPSGSDAVSGASRRAGRLTVALLVCALTLLSLAPSAMSAVFTREPVATFGPDGAGACPGAFLATGRGDLDAGTGTGDLSALATGIGDFTSGSTTIANVFTATGAFSVGESISTAGGSPLGTITAVTPGTPGALTISRAASFSSVEVRLVSGSRTVSNLTTTVGAFRVGQTVSGPGIAADTTIAAVGSGTLTLSDGVTAQAAGVSLFASSDQILSVSAGCGAFAVGQSISAAGIPAGTTIAALGAGTLTLSKRASAPGSGVSLFASSSFDPTAEAITLAFDQAANRLYLADTPNTFLKPGAPSKIHAFETPGLTLTGGAFPLTVADGNCCGSPIAVDNTAGASAGNLYYAAGDNRIYGYRSDGTPLGGNFPITPAGAQFQAGAAVDSAGNLFVSDFQAKVIRKYDSLGNLLATISSQGGFYGPRAIAFDSDNDLFVDHADAGLYKYTAASGYTAGTQVALPFVNSVAVDRSTDRLYVLYSQGGSRVSAFDSNGNFLYDFANKIPGAKLSRIAVDEGTDTVYLSDTGNDRAYAFGPAQSFADATAAPTAATNVTERSAVIGATITDNNALPTDWRLEISDDGVGWRAVASGSTLGGESGAPVSATATALIANTDYSFRVVTNKGNGAATEVVSSTLSFRTDPAPPTVTTDGAVQVQDTSARLVGTIDPRHSATSYTIEYGVSPALDQATAPLDIGDGTAPQILSQLIEGLAPDTDYSFRFLATNGAGTTQGQTKTFHTRAIPFPPGSPGNCPNEELRRAQGSTYLPDCRAYEMVSPSNKNLGSVDRTASEGPWATVSPSGDSVAFCTSALFGEPAGQMGTFCAPYISRFGADGWSTTNPFPPYCPIDIAGDGTKTSNYVFFSADHSRAALHQPESPACGVPPIDPAAPTPGVNLYRMDFTADPLDFDLMTPRIAWEGSSVGPFGQNTEVLGGSDDFSHIVYVAYNNQTDPPDSPPEAAGVFNRLYEWKQSGEDGCAIAGGCLTLVSKDTNNVPFTTQSSYAASFPTLSMPNSAVSRDGERIFFQNPTATRNGPGNLRKPYCDAICDLYMREDATTTFEVSAPECGSPCGADDSADWFKWATPGGDKAFFISCDKLTAASAPAVACGTRAGQGPIYSTAPGSKLYRWDRNAPLGNRLVDLSLDSEPGDGIQPNVIGLIGASDDGNTVYFGTQRQIVSGGVIGGTGIHVYRWQYNAGNPAVDYLGALDSPEFAGHGYGPQSDIRNLNLIARRVSPDGRYLLIQSTAALDPIADRDSDKDIYRWDEAEGWRCASCQPLGAPSGGGAMTEDIFGTTPGLTIGALGGGPMMVTMSDDGRVFFRTPDALLPQDTNSEAGCPLTNTERSRYACDDIYEWNDGTLSLLSSGTGTEGARLIGTTPTGNAVFFYTREQLVGWDKDEGTDIYAARTDGGFAEPPPVPPGCDVDAGACEGAGTVAANIPGAGSRELVHKGNTPPQPNTCGRFSKKAQRKLKAAKKAARRGQTKRARALRRGANNLKRRAKRCNRRQAS